MHTAVKIEQCYKNNAAVYVLDASRSVVVVQKLMDPNNQDDYKAEIREEYAELRKEYYDSQKDKSFVSLAKARAKAPKTNWANIKPVKPSFLGSQVFEKYDLNKLLPFIDWDPFFQTWQIRGKYPNRTYPKIFNDKTVGEQAQKLFDDAQKMLKDIIDNNLIEARGIIGFYPCNANEEDDIEVYDFDDPTKMAAKFCTIRQQLDKDQDAFVAMSDFIAPKKSGLKDYIGFFAVSAGFNQDAVCEPYSKAGDDYNNMMVKTLTDRLAEAFSE